LARAANVLVTDATATRGLNATEGRRPRDRR
jgi:hypothetical protein